MALSCRLLKLSSLVRGLIVVPLAVSLIGGTTRAAAQTPAATSTIKSTKVVGVSVGTTSTTTSTTPAPQRMRGTTEAQRKAAAAHLAVMRAKSPMMKPKANAIVGVPGNPAGPATLDQLYFSGIYPNYANSPLPNVADTVNCVAPNYCGIRKFVDTLPLLNKANDLGGMLPVAVPDTTTFPGSDYYEISLVQYRQQLHQDLPAVVGTYPNQTGGTLLRGYVQTNAPVGSPALVPNYLGPIIISQSNRPVRVKFTNALPTGPAGNLFLPTDLTSLGAGLGLANGSSPYLQNRATVHMHGGNTPWISDGTPHQWTIPAGDWLNTKYPRGASVAFVPDMFFVSGAVVPQCTATITTRCSDPTGATNATTLPTGATNDPGDGSLTLYYTNQQSGRLLFYHDHAYGITRLNVYAGEASAMLITDPIDADLTGGTNTSGVFTKAGLAPAPTIPAEQIPLVIQDKTFVPQNPVSTNVYGIEMLESGSGYTSAKVAFSGGCTTEPVATATVGTMMDPYGQYINGAVTGITMSSQGTGCTSDPVVTIADPSLTGSGAVAFAYIASLSQQDPTWDSAQWGSYGNLWYPHVYMTNQWPGNPDGSGVNPMGRWDYASWFWPPFNGNPSQYTVRGEIACPTPYDPTMTCPGVPSALAPAPPSEIDGSVHQGVGSTVSLTPEGFMDTPLVNGVPYPTLTVDPKPYRFRILSIANERTFNLSWFLACDQTGTQYAPTIGAVCPAPTVSGIPGLTEVGMVPSVTTAGFPVWWPSDGRQGGVPDPKAMGPSWIQIGTEGGVLPNVAVIPPSPVTYEQNLRSVTVTNIQNHGLLLMSAERADAIVDFTPYAGKTLILYNDAPAPTPGYDWRLDYYTGDADQSGTGGAPSTLAGFGPNTRTIMQVKVNSTVLGPAEPALNLANLNKLIPAAFNIAQPLPVVPEPAYSAAYGQALPASYPALQSAQMTFTPMDPVTKKLSTVINPATNSAAVTIPLRFKTIQELFDLDYGRMNATLGTELPLTNYNTQTTIPLGYIDPFTEDIYDSANVAATPVGVGADGSQIWMVIHNGVDSHAIHFHLYDVQLINRYGWDGTNRVPFPDEYGWKDTVRMNPLEIDFVALRPMSQNLPFPVPDSARLFDVTKPAGTDLAMSSFDPLNNRAPQINQVQPMGWEYVWHCHLLGHEENDMMREQVFQVPPQAPANVVAVSSATGDVITFTDKSLSETGFNVRRADNSAMTTNVRNFLGVIPTQPGWNTNVTWKDTTTISGKAYYYQVQSYKPDADYWMPVIGTNGTNPAPLPNLTSAWSTVAQVTQAPSILVNPTSLTFQNQAFNTVSAAQTITVTDIGSANMLMGAPSITGTNPGDFILTSQCPLSPAPVLPNAACMLSVTFMPSYAGIRTANLIIPSNDPINPTVTIPLTGTGAPIPLTITASSPTVNWVPTGVPAITPIVTGLTGTDTIGSLSPLACKSTYTAGGAPGTFPTSCSGATNPNNAYNITYVPGKLTVKLAPATMISPAPGSVLSYPSQAFSWTTAGPGLTYQIWISTAGPGRYDLYRSAILTGTSVTINNLPSNGKPLYVTLYTALPGAWQSVTYTYTAALPVKAALTFPTAGPLPSSVTFQWSTGQGVAVYMIYVSAIAPGQGDVYKIQTNGTSQLVTNIPQGKTIYVRLYSSINGGWQYTDYSF